MCLNAGGMGRMDAETETLIPTIGGGFDVMGFYPTNRQPEFANDEDVSPAVKVGSSSGGNPPAVAFSCKDYGADAGNVSPTLRAMGHDKSHANAGGQIAVASTLSVRRLTPRECERLQGFPDDYTLIPYNKKPAKDGPRYKALGNSMAVPVVRWIGRRIEMVEQLIK